ncbi:class I SAM-dependent methyltransferase [Streptomyces sp. ITFR-16]|uniref:class I SAM-dependent methyltransferase n=1 Tax=Streptomyces sp. ITFR-16 TaxID=3075198 RepID=UPI00288AE2D5|nr:class I SAM-dependent methyltransferase [Streptomyces sp. ITFR-16]WNI21262.1 class I SAM-dependent methyltransferase [Streptomyces sp. ITFR-16]
MSNHTGHGHDHHGNDGNCGHRHDSAQGHHHDPADPDWDVMGPLLERNAELSSEQYTEAARWIAALPTAPKVRRILDIGSGPGVITCLLAELFPEAEAVAVDGTPALLERTRARAERLGLGDRVTTLHTELPEGLDALGPADLIWAGNTLHHMGDQRAVLAGLAGLLNPGGTLALVEGGLQPRHFPRDLGFGRAGLEARMEAAQAELFDEMRAELPGATRETEDWAALFTAVGLTPQGTRSFLLDLPAPLGPEALAHVVQEFTRRRDILAERLDADDVATLQRLTDPEDPAGLHHRRDTYLLMARTVHLGRRD